jgi:hypothetical protein
LFGAAVFLAGGRESPCVQNTRQNGGIFFSAADWGFRFCGKYDIMQKNMRFSEKAK